MWQTCRRDILHFTASLLYYSAADHKQVNSKDQEWSDVSNYATINGKCLMYTVRYLRLAKYIPSW